MTFEFTTLFFNNQEINISMERLYQDHHLDNMLEGRCEKTVAEIWINQDMRGQLHQHRIGKLIHLLINRVLYKEMNAIPELHKTIRRKVHPKIMVP